MNFPRTIGRYADSIGDSTKIITKDSGRNNFGKSILRNLASTALIYSSGVRKFKSHGGNLS